MKISYESLIELLEQVYEKVSENEYVVINDKKTEQQFKIFVIKTNKLKEDVKNIKMYDFI